LRESKFYIDFISPGNAFPRFVHRITVVRMNSRIIDSDLGPILFRFRDMLETGVAPPRELPRGDIQFEESVTRRFRDHLVPVRALFAPPGRARTQQPESTTTARTTRRMANKPEFSAVYSANEVQGPNESPFIRNPNMKFSVFNVITCSPSSLFDLGGGVPGISSF